MDSLYKKINKARFETFMYDSYLGFILQEYDICIGETTDTAYTDGKSIFIGKMFLEKSNHFEITFIILHELLHLHLGHVEKSRNYNSPRFDLACDIVVNDILDSRSYLHGKLRPQFGNSYNINSSNMTPDKVCDILPAYLDETILDDHSCWSTFKQDHFLVSNELNKLQCENNTRKWVNLLEEYVLDLLSTYTFNKIAGRTQNILLSSFIEFDTNISRVLFVVDIFSTMEEKHIFATIKETMRILSNYESILLEISFVSDSISRPTQFTSCGEIEERIKDLKTKNEIFKRIDLKDYQELCLDDNLKLVIILSDQSEALLVNNKLKDGLPLLWCTRNKDFKAKLGHVIFIE